MKKSLLLIPSLVALSATPFIGLASCTVGGGDKPGPTPPGPESWEVTPAEMEYAISMEGVEYLQSLENMTEGEDWEETQMYFSPSKDHFCMETTLDVPRPYNEGYFEKKDNSLITWLKFDKQCDSWHREETSDDIPTPEKEIGERLLRLYRCPEDEYVKNIQEKCYTSHYLDDPYGETEISFYFENKKLIKFKLHDEVGECIGEYHYDEIVPQDPTVIDLNDAGYVEEDEPFSWLSSKNLKLNVDESFKFYIDLSQWPSIGDDGYFLEFVERNDQQFICRDIQFQVIELYVDDVLIPESKDITWWFYDPDDQGDGYITFNYGYATECIVNESKIRGTIEFKDSRYDDLSFCFDNLDA